MYAITHEGKSFGPDGIIADVEGTPLPATDADAINKATEAREIEQIKTGPDSLTLYIGKKPMNQETRPGSMPPNSPNVGEFHYCITTWLGTWLGWAWVGDKARAGFQSCFHGGTYRRPVTVRIFGTLYHGWYMESSGDYVRLKKAKKQDMKYGATRA